MSSLAESRKAILKLKGGDLARSAEFAQAVKQATDSSDSSQLHDLLSLLLVIFKHLRAAVLTGQEAALAFVIQTVRRDLAPALQPSGTIAAALVWSVECSDKISLLRASDVLGAACRLAIDLARSRDSSGADILVPLYVHIASGRLTSKGSLIIVNQIIASVPVDAVSESELLTKIVSQLAAADYASIRASIFVEHWLKKVSAQPTNAALVKRSMLLSILPDLTEDDTSAHSIVMARNLSKYLLPAIFKAFPKSCSTLLDLLESGVDEESGRFRSWIRVASLGSSLGAVGLRDLPPRQVTDAIGHADPEIRRQAFELLAGQQDHMVLLAAETFDLFKLAIKYNAVLPASSTRTEWGSAIHLFFTRLLAAQITAKRHARRPAGGEAEKLVATGQLERLDTFFLWLFAEIIDTALVSARRPPSYRVIVALIILQNYLTIFAADVERISQAFTPYRVKLLIGCQACEFAEVRARSQAILRVAPNPLPGYARLQDPSTQALLQSAWTGLANPRKTQNDAAVAALQIVFERVVMVRPAEDGQAAAPAFFSDVVERLERELLRVEGSVQGRLEDMALHGLVAGCKALVGCIDLTDPRSHNAWSPHFHRLSSLVDRIWQLTREVMALSSASTGDQADAPAHEIAKAYQVMSNGQNEDAEDDLDPRKLISGCWRATKEAGELLAALIDRPLSQCGIKQKIWSTNEINEVGKTFMEWMHAIRHRGTFSAISAAFAEVVTAMKKVETMPNFPALWLDFELDAITENTLSTTRRSAALPYSVLSIVAGDERLLNTAVQRLLYLARFDNGESSDITKVHAFNILKIVLLDARQSKLLGNYFEDTVMVAVEALHSQNWNVRNVALMLFSTLVNRSLQSARTSQHMYISRAALEGRQTFAAWHSKYPRILPYISSYLRKYAAGNGEGGHTALFPMLIILRSLKWSKEGEDLQEELRCALQPYLGSSEWQVRQVAAQSLSSLYSPEDAITVFTRIDLGSLDTPDLQHGTACLALNLMVNTLPAGQGSTLHATAETIRRMIEHVRSSQPVHFADTFGPIETEVWATYSAFIRSVGEGSPNDLDGSALALKALSLDATAAEGAVIGSVERDHARVQAAAASSSSDLAPLLEHRSDAVVSSVLDLHNSRSALVGSSDSAVAMVIAIALDEKRNHELRIQAMRWLCDLSPLERDNALLAVESKRRVRMIRRFAALMGSRNTLLREQGMVACAWSLAGLAAGAPSEAEFEECKITVALLSGRIAHCAGEDQSQPSREAAASALCQLGHILFSSSDSTPSEVIDDLSMLSCQKAILALLQDDDEDIRQIVADFVPRQLGAKVPVCQAVAHKMWWEWAEAYMARLDAPVRKRWEAWMVDLARDEAGYLEDDLALHPEKGSGTNTELFEQEKPNLFRDPFIDARHAATLLDRLTDKPTNLLSTVSTPEASPSPIDNAFAAQALLPIRCALRR